MPILNDISVFGLSDSIRASKYPMLVDTSMANPSITKTVQSLGRCAKGTGHDQFLTGIVVQFDITFSVKAFVELMRYHFVDYVSSQSTIHRMAKFDLDFAYNEYVDKRMIEIMKEKVNLYLSEEDKKKKERLYLELLYSNPNGFELTARMTTNYRQLKTIYSQRKNHKLPEWREFCKEIKELPLFTELVLGSEEDK